MQKGGRTCPLFFDMRHAWLLFLLTISAGSLALSQSSTTSKKSSPSGKTSAKKKTVKSGTKPSALKKGRSSKTTRRPAVTQYRQMQPTPERYREIQQALADKGYLKSEPTGSWDAQSIDALTRFQTDQKLPPTGKITSASLIDLGLGPKSDPPKGAETPPKSPDQVPVPVPVPAPENP